MIYCDAAATMPVLPCVARQLQASLGQLIANPSAQHALGQEAAALVKQQTARFASVVHAAPSEIIWTSGATESNTMLVLKAGESLYARHQRLTLYYHPLAHSSLLEPAHALPYAKLIPLPLCPETMRLKIGELPSIVNDTQAGLLLLPLGNNELGLLDPLHELWPWVQRVKVWVHLDAAQALGKIPIDLRALPCQSMSFSGHKIGAPVGIGALFLRSRPRKSLAPLLLGGGQQEGRRAGTLPTWLISAFAEASVYWQESDAVERVYRLQSELFKKICSLKSLHLLSTGPCLPHIVTFFVQKSFRDKLELFGKKVAYAKGSACSSTAAKGSHILDHLGYDPEQQQQICRLSFGPNLTILEQDALLSYLTTFFGADHAS